MVEPREIAEAVRVLDGGGIVGLPTETVYGLAADAANPAAVAKVFAAKGRPADHPLIVHVSSVPMLERVTDRLRGPVVRLVERFWPGPLTVIVPRSPAIAAAVTGGRDTVAVRAPNHPVALAVIEGLGRPVAAPSANRFGRVSPTTATDVRRDLGDAVDLVLDGGPCELGVESTIVDCTGVEPQVVRLGALESGDLADAAGMPIAVRTDVSGVSGSLASHYAPEASVVTCEAADAPVLVAHLVAQGASVGVVGAAEEIPGALCIGRPADVDEYAHHLYRWLRQADDRGLDTVVAVMPPAEGIGTAVRDRLRRASNPRPDGSG